MIKKAALFTIILFVTNYILSQQTNYSFIKKEHNHLFFSKDSSSFLNFYKTLDRVRSEKFERVNIVHMGGSHVQGGTWSNTFIGLFQSAFTTAGGGYFGFPYRIAKTNQQPYLNSFANGKWKRCRAVGKEFCLPLGMSAMNCSTNDSVGQFGFNLTKKAVCRYGNIVKVYHNFNQSFLFEVEIPDSNKVERKEFKRFGYTQFKFDLPLDSVVFNISRKDTLQKDFILYGVSLENDLTSGFYLAGLGANGASSSSFLRCAELVPQLESLDADLFILSLGVNDTQSKGFEKEDYIENYDSLITFIKKSNPKAAIVLTTTTDNFIRRKTSNKRTITARDAMFELMRKHDVAVWDLFTVMGGYKSMLKWFKAGLATKDKVHFTAKGYTILGELMYEAVNKSYLNNQQKK